MANQNLQEVLAQLPPEEKQALTTAITQYNTAKCTGTGLPEAYNYLRDVLRFIENKYSVRIFVPGVSEGKMIEIIASKVAAKTAPAATVSQPAPQTTVSQPAPQTTGGNSYSVSFPNLEAANSWLATQQNLVIHDMKVDTVYVSLNVKQVWLVYTVTPQGVSNHYQLTEVRKTRAYAGTKLEKIKQQWAQKNPGCQYVMSVKSRWGAWHFRFPLFFRLIRENYIILYKRN